jgi:hypothetical protein
MMKQGSSKSLNGTETTRRTVKGWNERKLVELYLDTIEIFR